MPLYNALRTATAWITPYQSMPIAATQQAFVAGRVFYLLFEVGSAGAWVDAIAYQTGSPVAGNVTLGIYGPLATREVIEGATLIATSASTSQAGATVNLSQTVALTASAFLPPGQYGACLEGSDTGGSYLRGTNQPKVTGQTGYYDRAGGYGALTTPCPAVTITSSLIPNLSVRVVYPA